MVFFEFVEEGVDGFAVFIAHAVDEENAIDMVVLVHADARIVAGELFSEGISIDVESLDSDFQRPDHIASNAWN
jgi:hypothetical protein